ncbi:ABC transporter ATP-binding protein/permease [Pseudonocardia sp. RS11V-5]|uniref:ABC transporter transmembrane domain-containing protein n=1 Tax=Pseudonocardia terrae TaxID=2905831 RepID=UPI001E58705A|nr:ABC transporter ATP-binding protein [Pseudonocardia terrae]MCE3554389.1 ABC transporter ATP-binding protein/permease [Pseudonocardia terrae]
MSGSVLRGSVLGGSIRAFGGRVGAATLFFCGHQIGEALVPVLVGAVIDSAVRTGDPAALLGWLALLAVDFAFLSTCYRLGARQAWIADVRADQRLRLLVARRLLDPAGGGEAGRLPGELASIATSDTKRVGLVNFALPMGLAALASLVVAAVALVRISVPLGLLILLGTPPVLYLVHLFGRPLERRSEAEQERAARAAGIAADLVSGIRVLKGLRAEPAAIRRYTRASADSLTATLRATGSQAWFSGTVLIVNGTFLAAIALVGGRLAATGEISVGQLVSAVGLAQFLVDPLQELGWVNERLAQARASAARIAGILGARPAVAGGSAALPERVAGAVQVRGLQHGPLRGLDMDARPGELLGVAAADAGDAVALLDCLAREADQERGTITLDGVPLGDYPPETARSAVLVAAHDTALFTGTVAENVTAAGRDPGPALAAARADQVLETLTAGADTVVAEQGRTLSGGQRQRIALARALAADAPVLVLHDPTTAVDSVTESEIADGLATLRHARTTLLVTSSPALLAVADRVLLVEGGRVVAEDRHDRLLRSHPRYREVVTG